MEKYVAYVGSYSYTGVAKGITIFDVDVARGAMVPRTEIEVNNSSYVLVSNDGKTLYSIADEGVVAFRILANGSITRINSANIRGMRGCHLSIDKEGKYIFVSGYHDGKVTVLKLNKDGSVGNIVDDVYHKGLGSVVERSSRPQVTCTKRTPDGHFVMAADDGIDQVKIYAFDENYEKLELVDAIRCEFESAPRYFAFSSDERYMYLMYEMKNIIDVFSYSYEDGQRVPQIEKIQTVSTVGFEKESNLTAATCMTFSSDEKHLFCANAGNNNVTMFARDGKSGLLECKFTFPISGEYPKDIAIFPDGKHIASVNHESGTLTFFKVDYEKNLLIMSTNAVKVNQPNCCVFAKVG